MTATNVNSKNVQAARQWIRDNVTPTHTFNKSRTSYGLKHDVERSVKHYISNDEFIQAAILEGYRTLSDNTGVNLYFNMSYAKPDREARKLLKA